MVLNEQRNISFIEPQTFSLPFLKEYAGPAERRGLERGGLEDSLG